MIGVIDFGQCFWNLGIQGPNDVIITGGDTLHWVRALGFSTHYSWNFGVFECDQVEVAMARYRENERITKIRNELVANEPVLRDKKDRSVKEKAVKQCDKEDSQKPDGLEKRKYTPSTAIAFQSLVPMKTLILDVVREITVMAVVPAAATAQFAMPRSISRIKMISANSRRDANGTAGSLRHIRLVRDHLFKVMKDSSLLMLFLKELNQSIIELNEDLRTATITTGLKSEIEDAGANILHCERTSCKMELFEAFVDCPKCGYICLQCAGGGSDATKGGCLGGRFKRPSSTHRLNNQPPRVNLPSTTESSASDFECTTDESTVSESQVASSVIKSEAVEGWRSNREVVSSLHQPSCPTSSCKKSALPIPQSSPEQCVEATHEHFQGARLLLKTPLTSLSKMVIDFAHLIIQVHPSEKDSISSMLGIPIGS